MFNEILSAIIVLLLSIYFKWKYSYWARKKVAGPPPIPFFGNLFKYVTTRRHYALVYDDIYKSFPKANYVGIYKLSQPAILLRDLDLIKKVLISEFSTFHDNDFIVDEKLDPLISKNVFIMTGDKWKKGRNHFAQILSPVKIKNCFPLINEVCERLIEYINDSPNAYCANGFEVKELCSRFTIEVVSSCAFGVKADALNNPNSEFWVMTTSILKPTLLNMLKQGISLFAPWIGKYLRIPFISNNYDIWLRTVIRDVIKNRKMKNENRNDFLQTVLELREKFGADVMNEELIVGYSLSFLTEGYETSSSLMAFVLYELAKNPDIQRRLQSEIDEVLKKYNGTLTYDAILELTYLDKVCYEALRMYPPILTVIKIGNKSYKLPQQYTGDPKSPEKVEIDANASVIIPTYSIHFDPDIYKEPFKFDPERFSEENKLSRHPYAWLPFSEGPRNCVGMKFGMTQSKAGLASMLANYNIEVSPRCQEPLKMSNIAFLFTIEDGIWINFEKRNNNI